MEKEPNSDSVPVLSENPDLGPMEVPSSEIDAHSFVINSSISGNISENPTQLNSTESITSDGEDEESPLKSFFCVDYLEVMHEEMLNPESSNHVPELDTHGEGLDLVCKQSECNFSTTDMDAYLKHEYEHIDGKSYECDVCHAKFNHFSAMRNHRISHLSHRPYKCRLCSKEFFRKDILVEHLVKQHSKQRPYRCPFCPRHFKLRPQLKLHLSNEHSAAMLIKTCKLCGFKAPSPSAFRNHFAICYMKRSATISELNGHNLSHPQVHVVSSEANAIDLGAVSQNFSFVPSHYAPYAIVAADATHSLPGPLDISHVVSLHTTSVGCSLGNKGDHELCTSDQQESSPRIRSLASSTTTISPTQVNNDEVPQNLVMTNLRPFVKSEPTEVRSDDSQNGNALPTSTMDLSAANVETSFNSSEAACCVTSPDLVKVTAACSSRVDRLSRNCRVMLNSTTQIEHSRDGSGEISKMRCRPMARESSCQCTSSGSGVTNFWNSHEKRPDANTDADVPPTESHRSRKRLCQDKSTSTETFAKVHYQSDVRCSASNPSAIYPRTSLSSGECCSENKSHILIKNKVENNSHTCPYCEIVFPDQTLYFLHRSLHSETHPWKCNLCGKLFKDKYEFNSHIISQSHR